MTDEEFTITYPSIFAGTEKSLISFFEGEPNLVSLYKPGANRKNNFLFVTDSTVATLECMHEFISKFDDGKCGNDALIVLGSGEKNKTMNTVLEITRTALDAGFSRNDIFVGIGGGVICDMTAFAASIYKRGVKVELVPTTLLAMVDASIGGKTGCDFDDYKNMIGTFYPAAKISYFTQFVQYLPENQYKSGLAEAIKTSMLYNKKLYELFKSESEKILSRDKETISNIINLCVQAKAKVVEKDFTEKGERAFLNLGHTFAHALETLAGLGTITHGEAVAWGIGRMVSFSAAKDFCMDSYKQEVLSMLEKYGFEISTVPHIITGGGVGERFIQVMKKDKKNNGEKIRLILQKGLCENFIKEFSDEDIMIAFRA